jgi:uncharacterized repeat protein (TIGR01451 family)/fimbrial isopeptide formation D2 family protein
MFIHLSPLHTLRSLVSNRKVVLSLLAAVSLTATISLGLRLVQSAPAGPASPVGLLSPNVTLNVPNEVLIGEDFEFEVRFSHTSASTTGYAPYIDLYLPASGWDDNSATQKCDGISFVSAQALFTSPPTLNLAPANNFALAAGQCPGTYPHPFTGATVLNISPPPRYQLVVLALPFGSFDPTQPEVVVKVTAHLSDFADLGTPLTIYARGGFRYGQTPTDTGSPVMESTAVSVPTTPTLFRLKKEYLGPEDEAVSGPNFVTYYPLKYKLTADIADGQKIENLVLTDKLPSNLQFAGNVQVSIQGNNAIPVTSCSGTNPLEVVIASPSLTAPGGTLSVTLCGDLTGSAGPGDLVVTFDFFIPEVDAFGQTIIHKDCSNAPVLVKNDIMATGDWDPLDPRDAPPLATVPLNSDLTSEDHILNAKCLAIQKSVKVFQEFPGGALGPTPGDILEYQLKFQVSDYFTIGQLVVSDFLADGQDLAPGLQSTFKVTDLFGNTGSPSVFPAVSMTSTMNMPVVPGFCPVALQQPQIGTMLKFDVSSAMLNLPSPLPRHSAGILTGGYAAGPATSTPATGAIVFYATIRDTFKPPVSSPHEFVDKHDPINNCVKIEGAVYDNVPRPALLNANTNIPTTILGNSVDTSAVQTTIVADTVKKSVYAVKRSGSFICAPSTIASINGLCSNSPGAPQEVHPGDEVTFRIEKTIPSSDAEQLTVEDWLPLPIFDVNDPNADGVANPWLPLGSTTAVAVPQPGKADLLIPDHTLTVTPAFSPAPTTNSLLFDYGTFNSTANTKGKIDLLFTMTVTNNPFADNLFLTNEVREREFNSFGAQFDQVAIAQVNLREPKLVVRKAVVAADNPNAVFVPAPPVPPGVTFNLGGFASGIVDSSNVGLINSNVDNVDANDTVTFAITIENKGGHPAFNVKLDDLFSTDCFKVDVNTIQVKLGSGGTLSPVITTGSASFSLDFPGSLVGLDSTTPPGDNIIVITFQAKVKADITPGCCENLARITHYASIPNGPDFVAAGFNGPYEDTARACIKPTLTKSVVATSELHTTPQFSVTPQNSTNTPQVTIGEIVRYHLDVVVPEGGTLANVSLVDALPAGMSYLHDNTERMAFVANQVLFTHPNFVGNFDLSGSAPPSSVVLNGRDPLPSGVSPPSSACSGAATLATFNLGNIKNNDIDSDLEYVSLEFNALVCNVTGNQNSTPLSDTISMLAGSANIGNSNAIRVNVVEPNLTITKTVSPTTVVQGVPVTYTVTITNPSPVIAFDVRFADTLPGGLILDPGSVNFTGNCSSPVLVNTVPSLTCTQIPAAGVVTVTYKALANPGTCPVTLTNNAGVTWTSLPGPQGTTINNSTMSSTPGNSGAPDGERNGTTPSLTLNDYAANVSTPLTVRCPPCTPAPAGMVAWYPGEGNANDIQGGNHGTVQNGTTFAAGVVGQAFSFDGVDDQVVVSHNANQNPGGQITIDAWVNLTSSGHGRVIAQKRSSANVGGYTFETTHTPNANANGLQFVIWIGTTPNYLVTPAGVLTLGTFQHVAATYNGATMKIYVDGALKASMPASGAITPVTDPFVIGRNVATPSFDWHGLIDEVELFNRALSQEEIQKIVNARGGGKCKCPPITLNPPSGALPPAVVNTPYTQTFQATGGCSSSSFTYTVTSGALPPGLTLSPAGVLSGTPTQQGDFTFTITATDRCGCSKSQTYTVKVDCPIVPLSLFNTGVSDNGGVRVVGHEGNFSKIPTFDLATGTTTAQFSTGASDSRGRGVEVVSGLSCWNTTVVYYTSISGDIHVAPYAGGSGGPDIAVLPNPRLGGHGIQDLDYANGILYAMTGYNAGLGAVPIVYSLNPCTGAVLSSVTLLSASRNSDGFTVLPNGDFLINDGDAQTTYRAYSSTTGAPTGLVITSAANSPTGVDYNPADNNLYFYGNFAGTTKVARTDLAGNPIGTVNWAGGGIEDISVIPAGASTDLHYSLILPNGNTVPAQVLTSIPPSYVPNSATSSWIGPGVADVTTGVYTYHTTFTLTGCDPSSVVVNGQWASDNQAVIRVNNVDTPFTTSNNGFGQFSQFSLNSTNSNFHAGLNTLDFVVTNSGGVTGVRVEMSGTVKCCGCVAPITLNPASGTLPAAVVNTPYSQTFTASGGDCALPSFTYSVTSGTLPSGVALSSSGVLLGIPQEPGDFTFIVTATDACGCSKSQTYNLKVECPIIIMDPAAGMLPATVVNTPYSQTFAATGGCSSPITYSVTGGALPPGLTLSVDGVLSGMPRQPGVYTFTITATDKCGCSKSQTYTLTVDCPMVPLPLFNTGVADDGGLLPSGAKDLHYKLVTPSPVLPDAIVTQIPSGYLVNGPNSKWIGPGVNPLSNSPGGFYTYQTIFNMPAGADLTTAVIAGQWASDNEAEIFLNGSTTGVTLGPNASAAFSPFVITTNFVAGANTLEFIVRNRLSSAGSTTATGLRVEMSGSVSCCPPTKAEKCVITTSEPHTMPANSNSGTPQVTIGEIIRYRLTATLAQGASPSFRFTDRLPSGLTYLGNPRVTFVSTGGAGTITSTAFSGLALNQNASSVGACSGPTPTFIVPASQVTGGPFSSGTDPTFNLGSLTNTHNDPNLEYVIVEFNALVDNLPVNTPGLPNQNGATLSNYYDVFTGSQTSVPIATSTHTNVTIVEPHLDVQKTTTTTPGTTQATFKVTMTNTGTAAAFDVEMKDVLPFGFALTGPAPIMNSLPLSCSQPALTVNGNTLTLTAPTMPVGCSVTLTFVVALNTTCSPVPNIAQVTYTSLPGGSNSTPVGTQPNSTGSVTPGPTGAFNGDRVYTASAQATIPVSGSSAVPCKPSCACPLKISRFRENGPNGTGDEFVEIFNSSDSDILVSTCSADPNGVSNGIGVFASAGNGFNPDFGLAENVASLACQIPGNTIIKGRGYYLCGGQAYSLGGLGNNGATSHSVPDQTIGAGNAALGTRDIPNDAGLALLNIGSNNVTQYLYHGEDCTGFRYNDPLGGGPTNAIVFDKVGFGPYGPGSPINIGPGYPSNIYPSLASQYCEGTCLQPVGDASVITKGSGVPCPTTVTPATGISFPVSSGGTIGAVRYCYGESGQYEILRRQTTWSSIVGTLHQDTDNNPNDFILVSPNPTTGNFGSTFTGISGVTSVLGAAGPYNTIAPPDMINLTQVYFPTLTVNTTGPQPSPINPENDPLGTVTLRFSYTNNSTKTITGLRFKVDSLSTLCGNQMLMFNSPLSIPANGDARNLLASPNCGAGVNTAIWKALNSLTGTAFVNSGLQTFHGTVLEDLSVGPPSPGALSPFAGGVDSSFVLVDNSASNPLGDGVTGGKGKFAITIPPGGVIYVQFRFGKVKTNLPFQLLITPMATTIP